MTTDMTNTTDRPRHTLGLDLDTTAARLDQALDTLRTVSDDLRRLRAEVQHQKLRGQPLTLCFDRHVRFAPECTRCHTRRTQPAGYRPTNPGPDDGADTYGGVVCDACTQRDDPEVWDLYVRIHNAQVQWSTTAPPLDGGDDGGLSWRDAVHQHLTPDHVDGYYRDEFTRDELPELVAAAEAAAAGVAA